MTKRIGAWCTYFSLDFLTYLFAFSGGGAIGAGKESNEKARVANVLARAFPERQVVIV